MGASLASANLLKNISSWEKSNLKNGLRKLALLLVQSNTGKALGWSIYKKCNDKSLHKFSELIPKWL